MLVRLEREVEEEFRPQLLARLQERIQQEGERCAETGSPHCEACGKVMESRGWRPLSFICRFGKVQTEERGFRCSPCRNQRHPLREALGVEPGRLSGSLARLVALLGVIVPYPLASRLVEQLFGIRLSTMTVWRCVQRLGEACERYTTAMADYHRDPACPELAAGDAPDAVVLGVDGLLWPRICRASSRRTHAWAWCRQRRRWSGRGCSDATRTRWRMW